jgi:hypothetical protein
LVFYLPQLDVHFSDSVFVCLNLFKTDRCNFINILKHAFVINLQVDYFTSNLSLELLTFNFFFVDLEFDLSFFRFKFVFGFSFEVADLIQLSIQFSLSDFQLEFPVSHGSAFVSERSFSQFEVMLSSLQLTLLLCTQPLY